MVDQKNKNKEELKASPNINNDQLGENASSEYAENYDNKKNIPPTKK